MFPKFKFPIDNSYASWSLNEFLGCVDYCAANKNTHDDFRTSERLRESDRRCDCHHYSEDAVKPPNQLAANFKGEHTQKLINSLENAKWFNFLLFWHCSKLTIAMLWKNTKLSRKGLNKSKNKIQLSRQKAENEKFWMNMTRLYGIWRRFIYVETSKCLNEKAEWKLRLLFFFWNILIF